MSDAFQLDPKLQADTIGIAKLELCQLRLMNDRQFPWFILVPEVHGVTEIVDLDEQQQLQLMAESNALSHFIRTQFNSDKLNLAAIGNIVSQLHIHHVGRMYTDPAWPKPVWGYLPAIPYESEAVTNIKALVQKHLL